jgi:hypothetical protein
MKTTGCYREHPTIVGISSVERVRGAYSAVRPIIIPTKKIPATISHQNNALLRKRGLERWLRSSHLSADSELTSYL